MGARPLWQHRATVSYLAPDKPRPSRLSQSASALRSHRVLSPTGWLQLRPAIVLLLRALRRFAHHWLRRAPITIRSRAVTLRRPCRPRQGSEIAPWGLVPRLQERGSERGPSYLSWSLT